MNPLSGTELSREAYSALFTLHNTIGTDDNAERSLVIMIYISKKEHLTKITIIAVIIKWFKGQ